ncbi:LTA synthase family protein [Paenibacillus sp. 481]|uniref:LTA synthase family protein n=1 Tax=Paenibacillus sp. 481 TaxID=2835869 RepID=UPI001E4C0D74|nr:LTA synthase family protein [Paenibacillus sp. 481]UHA72565.1 LTA synthase family protein [Paenibacillus sp. 481]
MKPTMYGTERPMTANRLLLQLLRRVDILFFVMIIMWKLAWFNRTLAIPNMSTVPSDRLVALGAILIVGAWTLWLSQRWRTFMLMLLNIVLTLIIFSDLVYYRYFQDFITVPVLLQATQVSSLGDSIASLIHVTDITLFIDWLVLIPLSIYVFRTERRAARQLHLAAPTVRNSHSRWKRTISVAATLACGAFLIAAPIQQATSTWAKGILVGNWWNPAIYNVTGLLGFHGYDIYRYAQDNLFGGATLAVDEEQQIREWLDKHRPQLQGPPAAFGKYKDSNVIVLQAEAFENFVIGQKVNGQEITPNLNALAKESMYFNRFFHQTAQGRTSDADFTVHASLHPLPTGSVFIRYPDHAYDMLPLLLKQQGYATGAYHAYDASFWNRYIMYGNMGYDQFMSKNDYKMDEPLGWSLGDRSFFRQSVERMAQGNQPFYSYLVGLTSHHPYNLPQEAQKLNVAPHDGTMFGDYLQSIHYVDAAVGEMIKDLKQRGLWDKTIFVFYGDHDNSILETEPLAQLLQKDISKLDMIEMKGQVPLLIHLPDGANAGTYDRVSGQLDIAPTLLHWLGIDTSDKTMMGTNLLNDDNRLVVQRNGSATDGKVFYVPSADGLFENGTCYKYDTRQPIAVAQCKPQADEAKRRLQVSDLIITRNAIQTMRESK